MTFQPTLKAADLLAAVRTQRMGRTLQSLAQSPSTNDACWESLASVGAAADGLVVLADYQTAGRGRFNRTWLAPRAASVLLSALIVQRTEPLLVERLSLIAGIVSCVASRHVSREPIQLRWPNDLVWQRRKVGGVLVESRQFAAGHVALVIGIGINCLQQPGHFPTPLRHRAASLDMASPLPISRFDLAVSLIQQLDRWLAASTLADIETVRAAWQTLSEPPGQRVRLVHAGRSFYGTTIELDPTGGLLVQLESGGRQAFDPATTTMEVPDDPLERP